MSATGSDSSTTIRYCGIPFCKNFRGTTDENVGFFKVPRKGTRPWSVWMINLTTITSVRKSLKDIQEICMLHFKPKCLDLEMQNGKPIFTLKSGATPLPLDIHNFKSMDIGAQVPNGNGVEASTSGNSGQGEEMEDVKFIDINEFRGIPSGVRVKPEIIIADELQPSTLHKLDSSSKCSGCIQLSIQLQNDNKNFQKAKTRIIELEKEVVHLKLKIQYMQKLASQASGSAVKVGKPFDATETRENKMITVVNVADIKPKLNIIGEEIPKKVPTSSPIQKNLNNSKAEDSTEKIEYSCKRCLESFTSMKKLVNHLRIVKQHRDTYECFICKQQMYSEKTLRNHIKRHDNPHKKRIRRVCLICKISFLATDLDSHLCGGEHDVQCEYCPERFTATKSLCDHLDNVHKSILQLHHCKKCPKYFPMIILRDYHQNAHDNEACLTCKECNKIFSNRRTFNNHKKTHELTIPSSFLCDLCGKSFGSIYNLKMHKENSSAHSSEPTIQCTDCPRKFFSTVHFKRHFKRVHTTQKCKCDVCGKLISIDGHKKHMQRHNRSEGDRRFACNQCPMKFYDSEYLARHKVAHSSMKQFHCRLCDQSYKYRGDLHKHLRTHFKDGRIYQCSKCQMRFKYSVELEKHLLEHYKEEKAVDGDGDQPTEEQQTIEPDQN